jgi:hypothetical protein
VSAAKPMGEQRRMAWYVSRRGIGCRWIGSYLTPRQWRRVNHKSRRLARGYGYPGIKGCATPRQRKPKRGAR